MAVSRKYLLRDIVVPLVAGLVTPLLVLVLAVPVFRLFGPEVRRVDPAVLGELRTIGRVVAERTETFHEYKSSYVDITFLVVHLGGGAKGDVLDEVERRLKPHDWGAEEWGPRNRELVPPGKTSTLVTVQPAETADSLDGDFREAVVASKLPLDEMVYVTLTG